MKKIIFCLLLNLTAFGIAAQDAAKPGLFNKDIEIGIVEHLGDTIPLDLWFFNENNGRRRGRYRNSSHRASVKTSPQKAATGPPSVYRRIPTSMTSMMSSLVTKEKLLGAAIKPGIKGPMTANHTGPAINWKTICRLVGTTIGPPKAKYFG